jgi:hypothetical protein
MIETKFNMGDAVWLLMGSERRAQRRLVRGITVQPGDILYDLRTSPSHNPDWVSERSVKTRSEALGMVLKKHQEELKAFFADDGKPL